MIRILQVLPTLNTCGGVENYLMNYYANMDLSDMQIDFCVHSLKDTYFKEKIEARGGKIFVLPPFTMGNLSQIKREIDNLFLQNQYDIVHCHQANGAYFYFKRAKKHGVKCRILHSHQTRAADKWLHALRNRPLLRWGKKYSTDFFACSELAGKYLYKKKPFTVINNAIDTEKFRFNAQVREEVRAELGLSDSFVIGHVGRFCNQKNQPFLIDIFQALLKSRENAKLLLVGEGETEKLCKEKVQSYGLQDKVIFLGMRTDAFRLYQAMDAFVLPSLYEGLPVVGVEAQCSGLPVITSTNVTGELALTDAVKYLSLRDKVENWVHTILENSPTADRSAGAQQISEAGYDIRKEGKRLEALYRALAQKGTL